MLYGWFTRIMNRPKKVNAVALILYVFIGEDLSVKRSSPIAFFEKVDNYFKIWYYINYR